jgi:hypothetical protein
MAKHKKENLEKLLKLIEEISSDSDNLWFNQELAERFQNETSINNENILIKNIHEYCIKEIIKDQANKFYKDFKIQEIKETLIQDFIRMEQFRREDNFEDFSLAMFQQIENIVIYLYEKHTLDKKVIASSNDYLTSIINSSSKEFYRNTRGPKIGRFIMMKFRNENHFNILNEKWFFNHKFRAVLYYFYYNEIIKFNTQSFDEIYNQGNNLYLIRNRNHRGMAPTDYQQKVYNEIIPSHNKYYFKFLGFLENFTSNINDNL